MNLSVSSVFQRLYITVVDALFPYRCLACGCFFDAPDIVRPQSRSDAMQTDHEIGNSWGATVEQLFNAYLCADCVKEMIPIEAPICVTCGIMFNSRVGEDRICADCISSTKQFRIARAPVVYDRALMNLIHSFKYAGKVQLAKPLAGLMLQTFQRYWEAGAIDVVIPVPLYGRRLRQRGFNQAVLLIQHLKKAALQLAADVSGIRIEKMFWFEIDPQHPKSVWVVRSEWPI